MNLFNGRTIIVVALVAQAACATAPEDAGTASEVGAAVSGASTASEVRAAVSDACARDANTCLSSYSDVATACVAGLDTYRGLTLSCRGAGEKMLSIPSCRAAIGSCPAAPIVPSGYSTDMLGELGGRRSEVTRMRCSPGHFITDLVVTSDASHGYVRGVAITCTDGKRFSVGGAAAGSTESTISCRGYTLFSGLVGRAGSWLDSLGALCKQVNVNPPNELRHGAIGGPGGSPGSVSCSDNDYAAGLTIYGNVNNDYFNSISLFCSASLSRLTR
jgi:hypothetical protein